ncbi:MAG: TonB family protein, partial [Gammaproteobacteria bacterium]
QQQQEQQAKIQAEQQVRAEQAKLQALKLSMEQEKKRLAKLDEKRQEEQDRLDQVRKLRELEQQKLQKLEDTKKKELKIRQEQEAKQAAKQAEQARVEKAKVAEEARVQEEADSAQSAYQGIFESYWNKPIGTEGLVCVLGVQLLADGLVKDVRIVESSGNAAFDDSAMRSVWKASPLTMHQDPKVAAKLQDMRVKFINSGL